MSLVFITHDFQSVHGEWTEHLYSFSFTNIDLAECFQYNIVMSGTIGKKELLDHWLKTAPLTDEKQTNE